MGIYRLLSQWKEKVDGTLTGPSLETDSATVNGTTTTEALEAANIIDGAGVSHTDELADKSDVGGIGFPYDINDTQDVPDSHSVVIAGPVNAIDGTLDDRNARVKIE